MRKAGNLIFLTLILATTNCFAQKENINTDRPDQSDGVYTIPKNKFQIENGIILAKDTWLNDFMLRYGLTSSTEIRLAIDVGREAAVKGLKPVSISVKQRIWLQQKIIPSITFVGYATFGKLASKGFRSNEIPYVLELAFENELNDKFTVGYNVGATDEFKDLILTLNFGYSPTDKFSAFAEYFSTIGNMRPEHNWDAGILFVLNPQLQFDIACGHAIAGSDNRFFATFGVSYILR